jgi:cell division protein FtsL
MCYVMSFYFFLVGGALLIFLVFCVVLCPMLTVFSAKHAALRRKSKDWLTRNQDNVVSEEKIKM